MPGLSTSLITATGAMSVFDRALAVIQNNVSNALTPGYARERLPLMALPFGADAAQSGGVAAGDIQSVRDRYAEQAVWRNRQAYGRSSELTASLARLETLFNISGDAGLPAALNRLFESFLSWSVNPNDTSARQAVIDRATALATEFANTATALKTELSGLDQPIQQVAGAINELAARMRDLNARVGGDIRSAQDPNLDAVYQDLLEQLAEYTDFTALRQADGTYMVLLGGQTPLVIGERQYALGVDASAGGVTLVLHDALGQDVTSQVRGGRLGALIAVRNSLLPSYVAELDTLASALTARVNAVLAAGVDANGAPGAPLFTYDAGPGAALTLRVTDIEPEELAAALPGAPGGNSNALNLAALANSAEVGGATFLAAYGALATHLGDDVATARLTERVDEQALAQSRELREQASAVSLDEEAARLLQFQHAYQAAAKVVTTLDEMLETVIGMLR